MNDARNHPENSVEEADQVHAIPGLDDLDAHAAADLRTMLFGEPDQHVFDLSDDGEDEAWASLDLTANEEDHQALVTRLISDGEALREELGLPGFSTPGNTAKDVRTPVLVIAGTSEAEAKTEKKAPVKEEPAAPSAAPGGHQPPPRRRPVRSGSRPATVGHERLRRTYTFRLTDALAVVAVLAMMVLGMTGVLESEALGYSSVVAVAVLTSPTWRSVVQRGRVGLRTFLHERVITMGEDHHPDPDRETV
ncbi:hypothetical protein [Streptomyces goshikiensis]|uniref:hypothetical protein n=1 Tax=Streptomyces goshikiensis TaxID=1942 RepID=UPI0036C91CD5